MDKKYTTVTKKDEAALRMWKQQDEELRQKRSELMYRFYVSGMSQQRIACIYGCTRQFVQQEIRKYDQRVAA